MLTLLSPAKKLDFSETNILSQFSQCDFLDKSQILVDKTREMSLSELKTLMKISDKLAETNSERYKNWTTPFTKENAKQAILTFKGDTYVGLNAENFSGKEFKYAQDHFRILSGLYGLLRPLDLIQPYRLEMGTKLENPNGRDLYKFWGDEITKKLNDTLRGHATKVILNCASVEYFKSVNNNTLDATIVSPVFKDIKNGEAKIISFFAKKARGMMARFVIQNRIDRPDDILTFDEAGYSYCQSQSTSGKPVFIRGEA
tara:strand:+ start:13838 stop:14611 length:774 start_codon:yes stop_codon:yes gene_type:complete